MARWNQKVRRIEKPLKRDPSDEIDTMYLDVDLLLMMYCKEFRTHKKKLQRDLGYKFNQEVRKLGFEQASTVITFSNVQAIKEQFRPNKGLKVTNFGDTCIWLRAMIYAMMCGKNGNEMTDLEFIAGCNRFGLDNPTPIINPRLAAYGNAENMESLINKLAKVETNYFFDASHFVGQNPDKNNKLNWDEFELPQQRTEKQVNRDMRESQVPMRQGRKVSGVHDIKMLDKLENAKKFESPAHVVLARGVQIKIKDIPKNTTMRGMAVGYEKHTNVQYHVSTDKEILVPSFGTTGALFARHFDILDKLKRRIILLKQAYDN